MPRQSVVINYIPRVEEKIGELFVDRVGNVILGDHLRNMLYSDKEDERDHVLNNFSTRVDYHKITLFKVMLDDKSLFLGSGLDDPNIVQKLADRMIAGSSCSSAGTGS